MTTAMMFVSLCVLLSSTNVQVTNAFIVRSTGTAAATDSGSVLLFVSLCVLLSSTNVQVTNAFIVRSTGTAAATDSGSVLFAATTELRVKSAGGGIPLNPDGNRQLFDPAIEGKLGGTDSLNQRLAQGARYQYLAPPMTSAATAAGYNVQASNLPPLSDAQHWLEDIGVPTNFAKPTQPVLATVLGRGRLISDDAPGDIQHVVMQLPEGFHYVEGQSLSVIPPGFDASTGKPNKPRLYSIASTRYGDLLNGNTVSLCVRRAEYTDPATGMVDPSKQGVCSNFLCNVRAGDVVQVAGPVGKTMLLPEDPSRDIIMVATGTGIAPFRAFLHRLFMENTVARHMFTGHAWLILGVPVSGGLLYPQELDAMQNNANGNLEVTYAISREMKNANGGKLYVQDVLAARAEELFQRLDAGAVIYFCGLKGMMPGILEALEIVALQRGINWAAKLSELKANHQWHVEVY
jgi:ferredoxin--NADP+ reductase